ncbi:hypothetical protein GCM10010381_30130 [Streptomyces xantholiticus]|nr:hypothetical protein GCM10010381_30130 [Streptomyces xantholiticus]
MLVGSGTVDLKQLMDVSVEVVTGGAVPLWKERGGGHDRGAGCESRPLVARSGHAGLYAVALFLLVLSLPAVGARTTPTSDPGTAAGALTMFLTTDVRRSEEWLSSAAPSGSREGDLQWRR